MAVAYSHGGVIMLKILAVHGDVLVDDASNHYSQPAQSGMVLNPCGNFLIVTSFASSARILVGGQVINLQASSFLRIRADRSWWDRHRERWSKDTKRFLGRLWALVARDPRDRALGSPAVGVRG